MRKDKVVSEVLGTEIAITPSDLYHADFKRSNFGGYDKAEVDAYLERIADVLEDLIGQVRDLKERNEELEAEMRDFRAMERSLREAMLSSQRVSDDMVEAARREAKSLIEEARLKKLQAQIEASKIPDALARDINLLKQQRMRLRVEITSILETHRQLLETLIPIGGPLAEAEPAPNVDIVQADEAAAKEAAKSEEDPPEETENAVEEPEMDDTEDPTNSSVTLSFSRDPEEAFDDDESDESKALREAE